MGQHKESQDVGGLQSRRRYDCAPPVWVNVVCDAEDWLVAIGCHGLPRVGDVIDPGKSAAACRVVAVVWQSAVDGTLKADVHVERA